MSKEGMRIHVRRGGWVAALGAASMLCACAITRPPGPSCANFAETASTAAPAGPHIAGGGEAEEPAKLRLRASTGAYTRSLQHIFGESQAPAVSTARPTDEKPVVLNLLLLSGGGEWGAYGSGFLNGLYANPSAPAFSPSGGAREIALGDYNDLTGISTGGIMLLDVWSAVIHARRNEAPEATAALHDLKTIYAYADPQLFKTENTLTYALLSNGLLDPKGRLESILQRKVAEVAPLLKTDTTTQVEVGAVNLTDGQFYSFQMPEVLEADALPCFSEILLASAAIPLAFPPRYMDGEPYVDGGIRYLTYADRFAADMLAEKQATGRPIELNIRIIINGNQSVNDPGQDAALALSCDHAAPGQVSRCPPVANSLLGSFLGLSSGKGLVPRVAQDVLVHQVKLDSVYRLYTRWKELGLPGTFKYTYVSNAELAQPPAAAGLSGPCQTPAKSTYHFDPTFEACLYVIGQAKGAAGNWDFSASSPSGRAGDSRP